MLSWFLIVLSSVVFGVVITLIIQFYFLKKYFTPQKLSIKPPKLSPEPFKIPESLLDSVRSNSSTSREEACLAINVLFQFLFHELRDTARVRKWFRNKLTVEFQELITRTTVGRMFGSIKVRDICLGSEFPVINSIMIDDVKINDQFSHIDSLDLKLDLSYKGGFRLIVDANMLLGKAAYLSIKVGELYGLGRLQFTRLPYSHWSFSFYGEPHLELQVESQFQGRPLPQITTLISNQIRKAIRKKHTLPNFKLRYKPFFTAGEEAPIAEEVSACALNVSLHHISRLPDSTPKEIYCWIGLDRAPWLDITNYSGQNYYLLDVTVTKKHSQPVGIVFKQEHVADRNKVCVVVESSTQPEVHRGDVLISIDGKKVSQAHQVPKALKASAVQITLRVERRAPDTVPEACREALESDSSETSLSNSPARRGVRVDGDNPKKPSLKHLLNRFPADDATVTNYPRLVATKLHSNIQILLLNESVKLGVLPGDRYLNISVRGIVDDDSQSHVMVAYVNIPLSKITSCDDSLHSLQLKPPDLFAASNSRGHKLSGQNGFIPLLCYGDLLLSAEMIGTTSISSRAEPVVTTPTSDSGSRPNSAEKRHNFIRTHLQSSSQCEFCGKKIWLKDAEQCRDCGMTCHKKCVAKCKSGTVCSGIKPGLSALENITTAAMSTALDLDVESSPRRCSTSDDQRRTSVHPEIVMTTCPEPATPKSSPANQSGTRKGLSSLLASVASAGRGLKRVGSAHNLQLPSDSAGGDNLSKSLPPSPQQTPAPSRKPSLPLELSEDISILLQTLLQQGTDQGDMMYFAKSTGKSLYEDMNLPDRKEKIQQMMNSLKAAIDAEAEVRFSLSREESSSKDAANRTKAAFLIGKSDEKAQALTVLMLHFCAGLQHIQDLEEQEREVMPEDNASQGQLAPD